MDNLDPALNWYDNGRLYPEDPNKFNHKLFMHLNL